MVRYRFADFTLSPRRRLLLHQGTEVPLIPRYFDLLLLLVERRHEAVHRREIFDRVWADSIVSDSALSQAVRTIRRALGDDVREPRFIRTVSRHGYRFVLADVIVEDDDGPGAVPVAAAHPSAVATAMPAMAAADHPWLRAAGGGALAGVTAGALGGIVLALAPGSTAPLAIAPVLAVLGGLCGAVGGAGVGAGLMIAGRWRPADRGVATVAGAAAGGGMVGGTIQWLARWGLSTLLGLDVRPGGGLEGLLIGAAAGIGYLAVRRMASPLRWQAMLTTATVCGLAGLALTLSGHPLVGGTLHAIAQAADGSRAILAPLGSLIGEPGFGPVSGALVALGEAAAFGAGLGWGLLASHPRRS